MTWHLMNYSDGLQWELETETTKCKVFELSPNNWLGKIVWRKDSNLCQFTSPCVSDDEAMRDTEKLLAKLEGTILGDVMAEILENWVQVDANTFVPKLPTTHEVMLEYRCPDYGEGATPQWQGWIVKDDGKKELTEPGVNNPELAIEQLKHLINGYNVHYVSNLNEYRGNNEVWYQGKWQKVRDILAAKNVDAPVKNLDKAEVDEQPVIDTKEARAKRPLWQPESESCYRPVLETVGGVAEIIRSGSGEWYGAVGVEGYVYTTKLQTTLEDACDATEELMEVHEVKYVTDEGESFERTKLIFKPRGMSRFDILANAKSALERGVETHGEPETSFTAIRRLWNAYLQNRPNPDAPLTDSEVADLMELMKVGRGQVQPQVDDYVDRAGYAALAGELMSRGSSS